ncbi:hypothetical protein CDN99_11840 [Roseateles aquatilis]|uniref:DUF2946 domain-containing protein n=1 Tax=Roseateles aquatilis TaxID=431061 RepID=A0A246JE26_9BURK|nr:DUF2946 family protein [Roseateles aquatilis]OWQ90848.1 hypothetical protein CDN99_11840 [Roseateles aquatilis]
MRKHLLHLLLPLFMLLSQQGAAWHEIGHLAGSHGIGAPGSIGVGGTGGTTQASADDPSTGALCEVCLAFDGLAVSARSEAPTLALAEASHVRTPAHEPGTRSTPAPQPRSRGPPVTL